MWWMRRLRLGKDGMTMKTKQIVRLIIWAAVGLTLCSMLASGLIASGTGHGVFFHWFGTDYSDYACGNATVEGNIRNLDIDWMAGQVTVRVAEQEGITIEEDYTGEEAGRVRYQVDGDTLRIRFSRRVGGWFWSFGNQKKALTVTVPAHLAAQLQKVRVDSVSAAVDISGLAADTLEVDSTSGAVRLAGTYHTVDAESTSGDVTFTGSCQEFTAETVSGRQEIATGATCREARLDTVSGTVRFSAGAACRNIRVNTVSGDVTLYVAEQTGFTLQFDRVSGNLKSAFSMRQDGSRYVCGEGLCSIQMDSVSGDLYLKAEGQE